MQISVEAAEMIDTAFLLAKNAGFEFVTPELMLYVLCQNQMFAQAFENCGGSIEELDRNLKTYLEEYMEPSAKDQSLIPQPSQGTQTVLAKAAESAINSGRTVIDLPHIIHAMFGLKESYAVYYIQLQGVEQAQLLQEMAVLYEENETVSRGMSGTRMHRNTGRNANADRFTDRNADTDADGFTEKNADIDAGRFTDRNADTGRFTDGNADTDADGFTDRNADADADEFTDRNADADADGFTGWNADTDTDWNATDRQTADENADDDRRTGARARFWEKYAVCLNDALENCNPLIGRQEELERTMQILCRREKNNPLHIGEPGVGKTAIVYGFARLLNENKVPKPLQGSKIFSLDIGSLLAGTQYRGDFEKRLKKVLDSIGREEKPVIYIDEIHNIVGAGSVNGGSLDISNILKPYLSAGHIRFIGATTYEEYKKYFEKNKSLVRRFQKVEIKEPAQQDAVQILNGLKENYESFHGVVYEDGVLEYAVSMSAKYINERFLPDKAIDLMDEAGAYRRMHPRKTEPQSVGRDLIDEIVSNICQIPKQAVERDETESLATLEMRLKNLVFGQDEAVSQAVNAVKFSRAGLLEENKPLACLLFVGPTGVGKTEIAKSLAKELGISLIRFDMSEYEEKHAVAKLIGAPAGYVGYEEGGLLTEEIRKHPHAVLLLDEIEKAHPDIYNILLQVMDYATLTDNQGRKADFRNVILIMTSNAGARKIGKPGIGFQAEDVSDDAIFEEVRRVFQPEFRNRLNKIVAFRSLTEEMAERIVEKKLQELQVLLQRKNVKLTVSEDAKLLIKKKGISTEFGAREIERVIHGEIKPLFADKILFGSLKQGGLCSLTAADGQFRLSAAPIPPEGKEPEDHAGLPSEQK